MPTPAPIHRVQRLLVELTGARHADAAALQARVQQQLQQHLLPLIDRLCTQLADAGLSSLFDGRHGSAWVRNLRIGTVDFASLQLEPDALGFPADGMAWANLGAAWIRGHASIAALEGKPLVITLARLPSTLDLNARRGVLQAWIDEVQSLSLSGFTLGNFYPPGAAAADPAGFSYTPDSDPADPTNLFADMLQALSGEISR